MLDRFTIKITGESGQGINSIGEILVKSFKEENFYVHGYREYPSLIKGGNASYQVTVSNKPVHSAAQRADLMVSISRYSLHEFLPNVKRGGLIIHSIDRLILNDEEKKFIEENEIDLEYVDATQQAILAGGDKLTTNVFLVGHLWCKLKLNYGTLEKEVLRRYGKKQKYKEMNQKVLRSGCDFNPDQRRYSLISSSNSLKKSAVISGNEALALGAVGAGCRAYYAYPMTPASSILSTLADISKETGMLVKQVEDEISAVQMSLGSSFAGTRAFTSTSGGGFDLMTESISMAGITEIPLVVVLAQRPGPATGLPTWSSASDLQLALHGGHGEFPRVVLAASDPQSAYNLIQRSFNIAEMYQVPVVLLTEKDIAESIFLVDKLPKDEKIRRGLLANPDEFSHRYEFTQTGVSPRWLPGTSDSYYVTNSDEHDMDGNSTEDKEIAQAMMEKRMKKLEFIKEELNEPVIYGPKKADISLVGWGSVKGVMMDLLQKLDENQAFTVNYLHFEDIYPLKINELMKFTSEAKQTILVENNYTMQLGKLIKAETGIEFDRHFNKFDGRPIYLEELFNYLSLLKK